MARRRSRQAFDSVRTGEAYYHTSTRSVPRTDEYLPYEHTSQSGVAEDTVYPWYPRARSLFYLPSPYRHERSEFKRRDGRAALTSLIARAPAKVRFCVQRKSRRQVLFALGRAGYSGSARKRHYVRRESSNWRC